MRRNLLLVALLCGLASATARAHRGRTLLQQAPNCARITNCNTCYNAKNDDSVTVLLCRVCNTGYRPTAEANECECAPGYAKNGAQCDLCSKGNYCPGASSAALSCGDGLTTLTEGARSVDQCVALSGYGYSRTRTSQPDGSIQVTVTATECPLNFYNPGSNSLPCRRCPGGLITTQTKSSNVKACAAGPGYLFDKMVAKACPRGTYKGDTSQATFCTKCPPGLTTAAVASTRKDQCIQSMPGFKVVESGVSAAPCERGSYNIGFNVATSCTLCGGLLVTLSTGAKSEASCLAPPGVGYDRLAETTTFECPANTYKSGFNRKDCQSCGQGFLSALRSDSKQKCYVPFGHGTIKTSDTETAVIKCEGGVFGYPVDTYGIFNLPCRPCQAGMTTWDAKPLLSDAARTAVINNNTDSCFTFPGYGYDKKAQAAKKCENGTYAAGWSKEPCMVCGDGYTTPAEGSTSENDCTIAPGWYMDTVANQVVPCDEGYYCLGMSLTADRTQCPAGTTTRRQGAESVKDCDVCDSGYGSFSPAAAGSAPSCSPCDPNTYGPKGAVDACSACPVDAISAPQSDSLADCYERWQNLYKDWDFLPVNNPTTMLTKVTGPTSGDQCRIACNGITDCVFYQWDESAAQECSVYVAPATASSTIQVGFKVDTGIYSVINGDSSSANIGKVISSPVKPTVRECTQECDKVEGCVALVVTKQAGGSEFICDLRSGELSQDLRTRYQVRGSLIGAWK